MLRGHGPGPHRQVTTVPDGGADGFARGDVGRDGDPPSDAPVAAPSRRLCGRLDVGSDGGGSGPAGGPPCRRRRRARPRRPSAIVAAPGGGTWSPPPTASPPPATASCALSPRPAGDARTASDRGRPALRPWPPHPDLPSKRLYIFERAGAPKPGSRRRRSGGCSGWMEASVEVARGRGRRPRRRSRSAGAAPADGVLVGTRAGQGAAAGASPRASPR